MRREVLIMLASIAIVIVVVLGLFFFLSSDSETADVTATPAQDVAEASPTAAPAGEKEPAESSTPEALATTTSAASAASPSSAEGATVTVSANVNLREGPGTNYRIVGRLSANESATVVGRNEDGSWLAVESGSGTAWLTGDPDLANIEGQAMEELPVVEGPVIPYNVNHPKVAELFNQIPLVIHNEGSFTCASHAGINNLEPLTEGNVIGPHAGDFVYNGNNVLFKYSDGDLVLIRENPLAGFEDGSETMPFNQAMQLFESGEIVWTGQLGQKPGRGVTGCDPATIE